MAENVKTINWTSVNERIEKDCGIPKSTSQEVLNALNKVTDDIAKEEAPNLKENDVLVIKNPHCATVLKHLGAHTETDEKGRKYEVSASIGVHMTPRQEFVAIANTGFKCERKEIK